MDKRYFHYFMNQKKTQVIYFHRLLSVWIWELFFIQFFFRFYSSHPHFHYSLIFSVQFLFIYLGWFVVFNFFLYFSFKFIVCIFLIILSLNFISLFYVVIWSAILLRRMRQNHLSLSALTEIYIFLFWLRAVLSIL